MELATYFETTKGTGVLATADAQGRVDAAIYARPHIDADGTIAFIMRDRLTHHNLQSNPRATYLFIEDGAGYKGKRLFLIKTGEEQGPEKIASLRRRQRIAENDEMKFIVCFALEKELPLIGAGPVSAPLK
jgi:hypothetical protein